MTLNEMKRALEDEVLRIQWPYPRESSSAMAHCNGKHDGLLLALQLLSRFEDSRSDYLYLLGQIELDLETAALSIGKTGRNFHAGMVDGARTVIKRLLEVLR